MRLRSLIAAVLVTGLATITLPLAGKAAAPDWLQGRWRKVHGYSVASALADAADQVTSVEDNARDDHVVFMVITRDTLSIPATDPSPFIFSNLKVRELGSPRELADRIFIGRGASTSYVDNAGEVIRPATLPARVYQVDAARCGSKAGTVPWFQLSYPRCGPFYILRSRDAATISIYNLNGLLTLAR